MKLGQLSLRAAALIGSTILVAGYVYERAGGHLFSRPTSTQPIDAADYRETLLPGSKSASIAAPEDLPPSVTNVPTKQREMLPGSKAKSFIIAPDAPSDTPIHSAAEQTAKPKSSRTMLPGSKAHVLVPRTPNGAPLQSTSEMTAKPKSSRTIFAGTKSVAPVVDPDLFVPEDSSQAPRAAQAPRLDETSEEPLPDSLLPEDDPFGP